MAVKHQLDTADSNIIFFQAYRITFFPTKNILDDLFALFQTLVLPAILSAVILTFSKAIGTFGTINYLGSPVQYYTLSSQLYMNINSRDTQTGFAMRS